MMRGVVTLLSDVRYMHRVHRYVCACYVCASAHDGFRYHIDVSCLSGQHFLTGPFVATSMACCDGIFAVFQRRPSGPAQRAQKRRQSRPVSSSSESEAWSVPWDLISDQNLSSSVDSGIEVGGMSDQNLSFSGDTCEPEPAPTEEMPPHAVSCANCGAALQCAICHPSPVPASAQAIRTGDARPEPPARPPPRWIASNPAFRDQAYDFFTVNFNFESPLGLALTWLIKDHVVCKVESLTAGGSAQTLGLMVGDEVICLNRVAGGSNLSFDQMFGMYMYFKQMLSQRPVEFTVRRRKITWSFNV